MPLRSLVSSLAICSLFAACFLAAGNAVADPEPDRVDELIPWLLHENHDLREIPFGQVIFDATGKKVLPLDRKNPADEEIVKRITGVLNQVLRQVNEPGNPLQAAGRINETSSHFEDLLRTQLNAVVGLKCDFPRTAEGRLQRSGYPDLRIVDTQSNRVLYLDPKLYAKGSRESSFRTFYFEPKIATNKVTEDAVHLIAGFEHQPKADGRWKFTRWDLVDLAHFKVRLKAEFQASNHDIYRPDAVLATSAP